VGLTYLVKAQAIFYYLNKHPGPKKSRAHPEQYSYEREKDRDRNERDTKIPMWKAKQKRAAK
jgi:hypothetical protein